MQLRELTKVINPHAIYEVRERDGLIQKEASSDFSDWCNEKPALPDYVLDSEIYSIFTHEDRLIIVLKGLCD